MGKIKNGEDYLILNPATESYVKLDGQYLINGGTSHDGEDFVFTAIQPELMSNATEGHGYGLQPLSDLDYVNCQYLLEPPGEGYWTAMADVSEPYVFMLDPFQVGEELTLSNTEKTLNMTIPADAGSLITFEAETAENKERQKWVFVKKDGSDDPNGSGTK